MGHGLDEILQEIEELRRENKRYEEALKEIAKYGCFDGSCDADMVAEKALYGGEEDED